MSGETSPVGVPSFTTCKLGLGPPLGTLLRLNGLYLTTVGVSPVQPTFLLPLFAVQPPI